MLGSWSFHGLATDVLTIADGLEKELGTGYNLIMPKDANLMELMKVALPRL